ncbi:hypothetical protein [Butyrivibrio sp.]|uniref:hypothetical protein n=1 Tax=Butyrivibrio sp. TaxID=28121 RepID=UPI0025BA4D79|nr:hypothetical protein [Butyrivibrio sp.]
MQLESHDLNTLRKIIRDLEEENRSLKSLLSDNGIVYESTSVYDEDVESRDVYDPDQGARIIKYAITRDMAKLFFICSMVGKTSMQKEERKMVIFLSVIIDGTEYVRRIMIPKFFAMRIVHIGLGKRLSWM